MFEASRATGDNVEWRAGEEVGCVERVCCEESSRDERQSAVDMYVLLVQAD